MFRRTGVVLIVLAMAALCGGGVAAADAGGAGTTTSTQHANNVVLIDSPGATNPCTGDVGTLLAISKTEVFHVTYQADGDFWVTQTDQGTVTFTPNDPSAITYSGHFETWFGQASNNKNGVQHDTSNFVLTGTDGSQVVLHMVDHITVNAQGIATANFSVASGSCT